MRLKRIFYFFALLLAMPAFGFGQSIPVAPTQLLSIGGGGEIIPRILKFDAQGNFYIAGYTYGEFDFDPSAGVTKISSFGVSVAKYSAAGAFIWERNISFGGGSSALGLDIDRNGNITVIGQITAADPSSPWGTVNENAVIWHLDANGNTLWEKIISREGKRSLAGFKVASDDAGNLIAVYRFQGTTNIDGNVTAKGTNDGLVVKYDTNGNVIWKFSLGATGMYNNSAVDVLVDRDNNITIAGYTDGTVNYNPLGTPVNVTANNSIFLAKYTPSGILQWVKSIISNTASYNIALASDGQDNIYVNGAFNTPITFGAAPTINPNGAQDVFIAKYSSGGNLLYCKSIGGTAATVLNRGIVAGPDNSLYLTGMINGKADFDPSANVAEVSSKGTTSMFLAKYDDNGNYQWAFGTSISSLTESIYLNIGSAVTHSGPWYVNVNSSNEILLTGAFDSTVNFDGTGCGVSSMTPQGNLNNLFIVRYTAAVTTLPVKNNTVTAPVETAVCPGVDPALISGSTPVGNNYTYQWQQSLDNKTFKDVAGAVSKDFDPPVITATTYYRRAIKSVCEVPNISNVITITLLKPATGNNIYAPAVTSFCNAANAGLIVGTTPLAVGTVDYRWQQSIDNVTFTDISGAIARDYDPPSTSVTTHYRRLITNMPCSINIPSSTVTIVVNQLPATTVSAEQTICQGEPITLNAAGGSQYSWSPATGLSSTVSASPVAKPNVTTTYSVIIYNGSCSTTLTVKVNVVARPIVNAGADKAVLTGDRVQLNAQVSAAEGATYSWTPATYLDNPNIANPTANPLKSMVYKLTVTSASGCHIVSDEVAINVRDKIIIPNTFTPNGDGINDILTIDGLDAYKQSIFTIFNRSGQQVFKSLAYPKPWDGTHNGKPIPIGTYYYVIELNNGQKQLSGYITVMK